jgi:Bacterial Ig-like domain
MKFGVAAVFAVFILDFLIGCANISYPTGGKKDTLAPVLLAIAPKDSLLNVKTKKVELIFDEYVTVSDVNTEVQMSPILSIAPTVTGLNKRVVIKIADTLLDSNTTYRLSLGKSIRDLHEGNPFKNYTYTFSTGSYFDSLELSGAVVDAASGLPDSGGTIVELYAAVVKDSEVVRHKPKYIIRTDNKGNFKFKGLPKKTFRIYALKETNGNLVYDGIGEKIAFNDSFVTPGNSDFISLRLFTEVIDTGTKYNRDTTHKAKTDSMLYKRIDTSSNHSIRGRQKGKDEGIRYSVNIDTSDYRHRSFDITNNINITFTKPATYNIEKIMLSYDSDGIAVTPRFEVLVDSVNNQQLHVKAHWKENTVYTLKLIKGFAKDTAGTDVVPSKYTFRTLEDEDYGKLHLHIASAYFGKNFILRINSDKDSVYQKPITDSMITLTRLKPATYTLKIVADKNGNGKWDTGDLLGEIQPEFVIPYSEPIKLKAGWDNIIDFLPQQPRKDKK